MQNTQKSNGLTRPQPSEFELFTGGKVPALAVAYNVAFLRVAGLLNHLNGNPYVNEKQELERHYDKWLSNYKHSERSDKVFHKLRDYFWKGYRNHKNSSGYELSETDRDLIIQILDQLKGIRNFQSHYWHDNAVLKAPIRLKEHIQELHDSIKLKLMETHSREVPEYEKDYSKRPLFKRIGNDWFFTREGRTFFLSFFLTRGEMTHCLSQLKGFKRNDTPEFKIKHLIYKELTHRDGAARQHYGIENTTINQLSDHERRDLLNARQAYKIISYLNDMPAECSDPDLLPLYVKGKRLTSAQDVIDFCEEQRLLPGWKMSVLKKEAKVLKKGQVIPERVVEHVLEIYHKGYRFHINQHTMQKLLLDRILFDRLQQDADMVVPEQPDEHNKPKLRKSYRFEDQLDMFVQEREHLAKLLTATDYQKKPTENGRITLTDELDQYYRFKLRSGAFLQELMGKWLAVLDSGKAEKYDEALRVLIAAIKVEPIEPNYYDFFFEAEEKPRTQLQFVRFAAHYLMDSNQTPDWHWACERFDIEMKNKQIEVLGNKITTQKAVNKRQLAYLTHIPDPDSVEDKKFRLSIDRNNQVLVGIFSNEQIEKGMIGLETPRYKFLLGHKALRNLIIAEQSGQKINHFFNKIISDFNQLPNKGRLLTEKELPKSFRMAAGILSVPKEAELKQMAQKRIETILNELAPFANNHFKDLKLSRSEKNRQVMRCYRYFDWKYPEKSEFKFLRQDEYQKLSVYHYCLQTKRHFSLIKEVERHMPGEIKAMLQDAKSLDELLVLAAQKTSELLKNWNAQMPGMNAETLKKCLAKLGVSHRRKAEYPPQTLPFNVHPILPLRAYFEDELNKQDTEGKGFSASKSLRDSPALTRPLRKAYYHIAALEKYYRAVTDGKRVLSKAIGVLQERLSEDILLAKLANYYLEHTSPVYRSFITGSGSAVDWSVHYLRQTSVRMPLDKAYTGIEDVQLLIKFHQLDDYLLVESIPHISKAAAQAIRRHTAADESRKKNMGINVLSPGHRYEVTYEEVFRELQRIRNESLLWIEHLMEWEKSLIDALDPLERLALDPKSGALRHINFRQVLQLANIEDPVLVEKMRLVRNAALHVEIPEADLYKQSKTDVNPVVFPLGWSFWELEQDEILTRALGYKPKFKYDYRAVS